MFNIYVLLVFYALFTLIFDIYSLLVFYKLFVITFLDILYVYVLLVFPERFDEFPNPTMSLSIYSLVFNMSFNLSSPSR